jgi:ankyrin repeat protein
LLEAGSPLDTQDGTGQSALHLSLRRSHTEIALLLIAKGCNYDLADENGDTPLIIAARIGLVNAAQTLCHIGAALNIQNKQMLTALLAASQEGHLEVSFLE